MNRYATLIGAGVCTIACALTGQYEEEEKPAEQRPPGCSSFECVDNCVCKGGDRASCETACMPVAGTGGSGGASMGGAGGTGGLAAGGTSGMGGIGNVGGEGICGNDLADANEDCDGNDLKGADCALATFGTEPAGSLRCSASCVYDLSGCTTCGTGTVEVGEDCDGMNLGGATCMSATFGTRPDGTLSCTPTCTFDTSGCTATTPICGDGVADANEDCDALDLKGATCSSATSGARPNGTLSCTSGCSYDTSACSAPVPCDATSCPFGCCVGDQCFLGTTTAACGIGGEQCETCNPCYQCGVSSGDCELDPDSKWAIVCIDATITTTNGGTSWDVDGSAPDPYCGWESPTGTPVTRTATQSDTRFPVWDQQAANGISASTLLSGGGAWSLFVYDEDVGANDFICGVTGPMPESAFALGGFTDTNNAGCTSWEVDLTCMP